MKAMPDREVVGMHGRDQGGTGFGAFIIGGARVEDALRPDFADAPGADEWGPRRAGRKLISVVTPCFNERDNLADCYEAVKQVFAERLPAFDLEHIFCDNASTDGAEEVLRGLAARDPRVKVILNARNFGPFCSTFNGLMSASGDAVVVLLAADLQDPPELIAEFVRLWSEGHQVVYGIRGRREEGLLLRCVRHCYYRVVSRFAQIKIPPDVGEFQLIDRVVVDALSQFDDYYPYIRGMIASCGFKSTGVEYVWRARRKGLSKNRLFHLIDQGLNGIISFTRVPMRLCMLFGFLLSGLSIFFALFSLIWHLVEKGAEAPPGVPTLIVALFFFSGVQFFFLGVLGEYICAIHSQVRKRPLVIERERINYARGAVAQGQSRRLAS
jgi:polyisoprenyl-phosphate glycosyltransferase